MRIVVNACYGGFGLSEKAVEILGVDEFEIERTNEKLIELIESKGSEFVGAKYSKLKIIDLPADCTDYTIVEYDGMETIYYVVSGKIYSV